MGTASCQRRARTVALVVATAISLVVPGSAIAAASSGATGWAPVELAPVALRAELVATDADAGGIGIESAFRLTSLDGTPADELLAGLEVEPAVDLVALREGDGASLTVRPSEPLQVGHDYRFTLRAADGALVGAWAFRTRAPLRVVGTLPGNGASRVPVDTGIEIVFDRPGAEHPGRNVSIEPEVAGRFRMHDETLVFVPERPLAEDTVYRVRLRAGVGVTGSAAALEEDVRFAFKTSPPGPRPRPRVTFTRRVLEVATDARPVIPVDVYRRDRSVTLEVHRLGSFEDAVAAVRDAQEAMRWSEGLALDTSGLTPMGVHTLEAQGGTWPGPDPWVELPGPLPSGWYVLVIPHERGDAQMVLQVSDLAAFTQVSITRSLAWVHDALSGEPVSGAEVSLADGTPLGRTDPDGLALFDTPSALLENEPSLFVVRDAQRAVLVPFGTGGWSSRDILPCWTYGECGSRPALDPDAWWTLLYTDRRQYRPTDSVGIFGAVRHRDSGEIPASVEVRLSVGDAEQVMAPPPVASVTVQPTSSGAFSARIPLDHAPLDWYEVELRVDGETLDRTGLEVARIVKPDYRLELATSRQVAVAGQTFRATARASFFDGTSVPALPVRFDTYPGQATAETDAFGRTEERFRASLAGEGQWAQWAWREIAVRPDRGEEAEIAASTEVLVFRSGNVLSGEATVEAGRATLTGAVHRVALTRLEREAEAVRTGQLDPRGQAVAGVPVRASVTEVIPVRTQTGTVYDFIARKAVPVYRYSQRREPHGSFELVSGSDGSFELGFPVDPANGYVVALEAEDASGRATRLQVHAREPEVDDWWAGAVYVAPPGLDPWASWSGEGVPTYAVGEPVVVAFHAGREAQPVGDPNRYLFSVGQRGLDRVVVQGSPTLSTPFTEADVPSVTIAGVRWTGSTYLADAWGYTARLRPDERSVDVRLTPDRAGYRPGEEVSLEIRTTGADGEPVSADVLVRVVDEKLFAIRAAEDIDPLADLYRPVEAGWRASYASHQVPRGAGGADGEGDAAGGGPRQDFRDRLAFRMVRTDADGSARLSFDLSDDLTSWRVSATALTPDLRVGEGRVQVPVGLPFFVEVVTAPEYLVADAPAIRVRSYGDGLAAGDVVAYEVDMGSLGGAPVMAGGEAFEEVAVALPSLSTGTHAITVSGSSGDGGAGLSDAVVRTFTVVGSHLEVARMAQMELEGLLEPTGGPGLTSVVVSDAGRGRFQGPLAELAAEAGPRADQVLAAAEARRLLVETFGVDPASLGRAPGDAGRFQGPRGGISLLPYADPDLELSMLVALAAPSATDSEALARYLRDEGRGRAVLRTRAIMALTGLAALGEPVLAELREAAGQADLSVEERLRLAIGLAEAGDHAAALAIERALLAEAGEQRGTAIRLRAPDPADTSELTALLAVLAAAVGDDAMATAADAHVRADPPADTLATLQGIAFATRSLDRATSEPASFAWTLDGRRSVVDLPPGETFALAVTPEQLTSLSLERLAGDLLVTSTWAEPLGEADLAEQDPGIRIRRSVAPEGVVPSDAVARVRIDVTLGPDATRGCYLVTEQVPAGLAPVRMGTGRPEALEGGVQGPWTVSGQRVTFCAFRDAEDPVTELGYLVRVVTPGRYAWEPTLVQSVRAPQSWRLGEASEVETR
jgi:alpha-2-macroglobulin